jgi:valyl-tRNA synthetase
LSLDRVGGYKAFANKLWNASRFALINLGDYRADAQFIKDRELALADRWILARLNRVIGEVNAALSAYLFSDAASALYQFLWHELCDWYIELSKGALYGEQLQPKQSTRAVLVFCLDQTLRLLHPFMPFITEEIWQKLPLARTVDSIMIASYPAVDLRLEDGDAEAEMAPLIEAIEGIRNIRGESSLSPAVKIPALIQSSDQATRQALEKWRHYLLPLAGLSSLTISPPGPRPEQAAAVVASKMEIYVPLAGLVDLKEEKSRLTKEITKVDADLESLARKLGNPNFASKAPAEIVQKDRARVEELRLKRAKLQDHLNRVDPEARTRA